MTVDLPSRKAVRPSILSSDKRPLTAWPAIPFICLILTLTLLALNNVFLYTRSSISLSGPVRLYAQCYGIVLFLVTFTYLWGYINGLFLKVESLYLGNIIGKAGTQALDISWTVLVSVFPIIHATVLRKRVSQPVLIRLARSRG